MSNQQPGLYAPTAAPAAPAPKAGIFDVRFTKFLSLSLISVWWVVALILIGLAAVIGVILGFSTLNESPLRGIGYIIGSAAGAVVLVVLTRLSLEGIAVLFRIANNTSDMAQALRRN